MSLEVALRFLYCRKTTLKIINCSLTVSKNRVILCNKFLHTFINMYVNKNICDQIMINTQNTSVGPIHNPKVIEFASGNEAKGFHILMLSNVPVKIIGKNQYAVSDRHCVLLQEKGINYIVKK